MRMERRILDIVGIILAHGVLADRGWVGGVGKHPPVTVTGGLQNLEGGQNFSKKIIKNKYLMELMGIYRIFLATFGGRFFMGGSFLTQNFGPGVCVYSQVITGG